MYEKCFHNLFETKNNELFDNIYLGVPIPVDSCIKLYKDTTEKLKKADLYGKTLRVTEKQLPHIYAIVKDLARDLDMEVPEVFVYENFYYDMKSYGIDKYWIELSASLARDLSKEELTFCFAREMFKIKYEITKKTMIALEFVGLNNHNVPVPAACINVFNVAFCQWLRIAEYSSDNFGFYKTKNIKSSIDSIMLFVLNNRDLVDALNICEYLHDTDKIEEMDDTISVYTKNDEKIPYGQYRIKNLIAFASACA